MSEWEQIQPAFRRLVFKRGAEPIAKEIPAGVSTVYTWANGERRPRAVAQRRIREILRDGEHPTRDG